MMHEYRVLTHDWSEVLASSPNGAAQKKSRQESLAPGSSIIVVNKKGHPRRYTVGQEPNIIKPVGRMDT